jgi:FAD/FMN-containing dehydrogenase
MLTPMYQGMTCQPPSLFDKTGTCEQGGYPLYVVNVSSVAQIKLAVNFARNTGIRLVIKNTGHDFAGKSGGATSLSVWTHNLKDIAFIPSYEDDEYSGPAIKAGVGVQGFELYAAANQFGVIALGGECPTVGKNG